MHLGVPFPQLQNGRVGTPSGDGCEEKGGRLVFHRGQPVVNGQGVVPLYHHYCSFSDKLGPLK